MPGCSAFGCSNRSEDGVCLKVFPRDPVRRAIWAAMANRKNWSPKDTSYLCEKHFDESQWEMERVDGKKKLKSNAIPTIFEADAKRKKKGGAGRRRKQLKTEDDEVVEFIEKLEARKLLPHCVICCRPLVNHKKEYLGTLTSTSGLSLQQCLIGISGGKPTKIDLCTDQDMVCFYCAHLINYADKLESELAKLKDAINGCLEINGMSEEVQDVLKPKFDSHVTVLDEFSERVVGPGSAASREAELNENAVGDVSDIVIEKVVSILGNQESMQFEEKDERRSVWKNSVESINEGGKKQKQDIILPPPNANLPKLQCKICHLMTTSSAVLLFHLRRHMADYQWCDFCDTPIYDEDNEPLESNKTSDPT